MDGVFLRKMIRFMVWCMVLWSLVWCGTLLADRQRLSDDVVRLHIVANSDSAEDQTLKLLVRDAVTEYLTSGMEQLRNADDAKRYIGENLQRISEIAQEVLDSAGSGMSAEVSFLKEAFDTRGYEAFTMPAGIYDALRITIGQGQGKNWWCVVFPDLCMGAVSDDFEAAAAGAGFPDSLIGALEGEKGYVLRFFLLDALGKLENIFRGR